MKKLGIVGGTGPATTSRYYLGVIEAARPFLPAGRNPEIAIESLDCGAVFEALERPGTGALASIMTQAAGRLATSGAQVVAFAGFTAHLVLEEVREALPGVEVVSILDPVRELARLRGWRRVGLLGSPGVLSSPSLFSPLEAAGVKLLRPDESQWPEIRRLVETEVEFGIERPESQHWMAELARGLCLRGGAEAILLANTDFPKYFERIALPAETIDPVALHIAALARRIVSD